MKTTEYRKQRLLTLRRQVAACALLVWAVCAAVSTVAEAQQVFGSLPAQVAESTCPTCLTASAGTVVLHYTWTATNSTLTQSGDAPPSTALAGNYYLTGPPTGSNILISKIQLRHNGFTVNVFESFTNGTVWYPTLQWPATSFSGTPVNLSDWTLVPTVLAYDSSSILQVNLAITWTVPQAQACTYAYSTWGACQSTNTQTRTVVAATPAGCTGTPVLSQACTYLPPGILDVLTIIFEP